MWTKRKKVQFYEVITTWKLVISPWPVTDEMISSKLVVSVTDRFPQFPAVDQEFF